jgi:putative transposase
MSQPHSIKSLEFKLSLNATQAAIVDDWLDTQRWVWNRGLALLKEFEAFSHYNKHDKAYAPCCPVPWEYRWTKDGDQWVAIPYSPIRAHKKAGLSCPLPRHYREPQLDRDSEYSLTPLFAHKLHEDKPWFRACPYKITQGTIKLLATSWQEYRKGKRKSPRFKRRRDNRTLNDTQSGNAKVDGGFIKLPKLGRLRVRSLEDRWPEGTDVKSYRIMKEPSGYYLLLVGELPCERAKPTTKMAGFDAGVVHILNDDAGHHIDIPSPLKRRLRKIKRLSRKAARQQKGSNNQAKTYRKLARVHESVRRDRRAWHHKLSTFAVRKYAGIAVEDLKLANMTRRPKAKPKADGTGYERNMAKAKAGLNRAILDAGIGSLYAMIEAKSKAFGRKFVRVNPAYTSQTCNACGEVNSASRLTQSEFVCVGCGHTDNADTNAARNIRDTAFPEKSGSYLTLGQEIGAETLGNVKPVESARVPTVKQEVGQPTPLNDVEAIPPKGASSDPRDTLAVSQSQSSKSSKPVAKRRAKTRSAQRHPEMPLQLGLWDAAAETG